MGQPFRCIPLLRRQLFPRATVPLDPAPVPSAIQQYVTRDRSLETVWRSIILFGRNVASYKFALGKSLLELGKGPNDRIRLEDLAVPFARHICAHLKEVPRQCTSQSSRFLAECGRFIRGEIAEDQLRLATAPLGFENVIDAFHVVGTGEVPFRFFVDERSDGGGIRLTEDLRRVVSGVHAPSLEGEVESRWRLVEAAWGLGMPPMVHCDPADHSLLASPARRTGDHWPTTRFGATTSSRAATSLRMLPGPAASRGLRAKWTWSLGASATSWMQAAAGTEEGEQS